MVWGSIPYGDPEFFFFFFHARDKTNNVFLDITFTLKTGNADERQGLHMDVTKWCLQVSFYQWNQEIADMKPKVPFGEFTAFLFVCLFVCFSSNLRSFIMVFSFKITKIFSDSKYHDLLLQKDTTWHRASVQFTKGWQLNEISHNIRDFPSKISHVYFLLQLSATFPSPPEKYKCIRKVFTPKMINHLIYSWHNGKNGRVCNDSCFNSILS